MANCTNCTEYIPLGARFCLACGAAAPPVCLKCGSVLEDNDAPCPNCSLPKLEKGPRQPPEDWVQALANAFMQRFQQRLNDQGLAEMTKVFYRQFLNSTLRQELERLLPQLASRYLPQGVLPANLVEDPFISRKLDSWLDRLWVKECANLLPYSLTPALLQYEGKKWSEIDPKVLIKSALQWKDGVPERVYWRAYSAPPLVLQGVVKSFLKLSQDEEEIYCIYDLSLRGTGRYGFSLSENGIYWRSFFQDAQYVNYRDLRKAEFTKRGLVLDGNYLNVDAATNYRLWHLLFLIQRLQQE